MRTFVRSTAGWRLRAALAGAMALVLGACAAERTVPYQTAPLPESSRYASAVPAGTTAYSNASLARIFRELTHGLEWGAKRPALVRFQGPVRVRIQGPGSDQYRPFLNGFLNQIRTRSEIDIAEAAPGAPAEILVRMVPGAEFQTWTANQCVIIFGQPSWEQLQTERARFGARAFETSREQESLSILIPDTSPPHEIRECLMEEVTQALGTSNDLYGLSSSIFNDDNAHAWPTTLDYLMLRVLYDPLLEPGLDQDETEARARRVLDEINPAGRAAPPLPAPRQAEFADWRQMLQLMPALGQDVDAEVLATTEDLLREAEGRAPASPYHCEAKTLWAVASHYERRDDAVARLTAARDLCARVHGADDVRLGHIDLYLAVEALEDQDYKRVLETAGRAQARVLAHGQEGLVASTHVLTWAAHLGRGDEAAADKARRDAIAWSAYAFGGDSELVQEWKLY